MTEPGVPSLGGVDDTLTVQVQGAGREPERVLTLSRPRGGVVEVREFAVGGPAPRDYRVDAGELLDQLEQAARARRRLSEDLYTIRRWLNG
jgi:hypothetical protein